MSRRSDLGASGNASGFGVTMGPATGCVHRGSAGPLSSPADSPENPTSLAAKPARGRPGSLARPSSGPTPAARRTATRRNIAGTACLTDEAGQWLVASAGGLPPLAPPGGRTLRAQHPLCFQMLDERSWCGAVDSAPPGARKFHPERKRNNQRKEREERQQQQHQQRQRQRPEVRQQREKSDNNEKNEKNMKNRRTTTTTTRTKHAPVASQCSTSTC